MDTHASAATNDHEDEHPDDGRPTNPTGSAQMSDEQRSYLRFAAMIATSMVVMFVIMYLNTYELAHVQWSETRFFMTWVMGAAMAVIMLTFMLGMHKNKKVNVAIYLVSVVVFAGALWLVRSQATVEDTSFMRAMTPHHSIAILTSERANIEDVRVRELADEIIAAQRREIAEMEWLIADIEENGVASTEDEAEDRPVPEFDGEP
jgi:FlaA1/EpsC-like NDP-sugar epimerase